MSAPRLPHDVLTPLVEEVVARLPELLAAHPKLRTRLREALHDDLVDQKSLPPTVPARAYLVACRAGLITGATKKGRRWVACRADVVAWWTATEQSSGGVPVGEGCDPAVETLRARGFLVDLSQVSKVAPRKR